jgi:excisionase family DNA binding protein
MKRKRRRDDPARLTYTVEETARILGVGESTVRRRISDENIPTVGGLGERIKRIPKWWLDKQVGRPEKEPK